mgnify:CR=1 FL=1
MPPNKTEPTNESTPGHVASTDQLCGARDRCPKCGGNNGFEGVLVMRYSMVGVWGETWQTSGDDRAVYRSRSVRCVDCGGRVDIEIADGTKRPNSGDVNVL